MLCLKNSTIWPQKLAAEIMSWDANQNPIDLSPKHTWITLSHCVLSQKMTFLRCTCFTLNIRIRCVLIQYIYIILYIYYIIYNTYIYIYLPKHTWTMCLHGVLIMKCIILLIISIFWNHWGDLRSHGVLHICVLRLQWAKKSGWLFLAVGGRSSMPEWQLTATLGRWGTFAGIE